MNCNQVLACVMPIGRRILIVKRWILHEHKVQCSSVNKYSLWSSVYLLIGSLRNHDLTILSEITGDLLMLVRFNHSQSSTFHISQHLQQLKVVNTSFLFSWATEIPVHHVTWQLMLSPKTAVDWRNFVRDICAEDVQLNPVGWFWQQWPDHCCRNRRVIFL